MAVHVGLFALLVLCAILARGLLQALGLGEWDRLLGIAGSALILGSFAYSLRKRKILTRGRPPLYLRVHEILAWTGAVLVLVHGGARFEAVLPWLAQVAMLVVVASGLTGKYLLQRAKRDLAERKKELAAEGVPPKEIETRVLGQALVVSKMARWRDVHIPLTLVFGLAALAHAAMALFFWRW
ncbi:MAG: hypothetical protein ACHQ1G_05610 [Planctomycetota bacterium]